MIELKWHCWRPFKTFLLACFKVNPLAKSLKTRILSKTTFNDWTKMYVFNTTHLLYKHVFLLERGFSLVYYFPHFLKDLLIQIESLNVLIQKRKKKEKEKRKGQHKRKKYFEIAASFITWSEINSIYFLLNLFFYCCRLP